MMDHYEYDDYGDYYPYGKKKNGFGRGVITGVLGTLVAVFLAAAVIIAVRGIDQAGAAAAGGQGAPKGGAGSAAAGEASGLAKVTDKLEEIQGYIDSNYLFDYDESDLADGAYLGMVYGLGDPYSYYYNEEEYAALEESYSGEYCGIGILVSQDAQTGEISILRVFDGTAMEAGLKSGDILYQVDGVLTSEASLDEVADQIAGEEGTVVDIEVFRPSSGEYLQMTVERRQLESQNVEYEMLNSEVGYILLYQFEGKAAEQLKGAMDDLESQGMQALVLDLRDNPGGDLGVLLEIADMFLPEGVVLTMENAAGYTHSYYSSEGEFGKPLVVLVNENSASAAEALSGAIQDREEGILVGTQTFGKGIVQTLFPLSDGDTAVKLTTDRYYTPGGTCIHGTGITPDVTVELTEGEGDSQLEAALQEAERLLQDGLN